MSDAAPDSDVDIATGDDFERFLSRLREIATNWRYSDEFIGLYVRSRWPADYSHQERGATPCSSAPACCSSSRTT